MKRLIAVIVAGIAMLPLSSLIAADAQVAKVQAVLKRMMPNGNPDSVAESTINGLYEAVYGAQVIYVTSDGRYMVEGDIYDINKRVNLTEERRQGGRLKAVQTIPNDTLITFTPGNGEVKHVITAFTDIDCGYCRKLHREMADYNKLGIEIRYAAFPRAGLNSKSFHKAENVWCAKDQQKAMNFAKNGAKLEQLNALEKVKDKDCAKPIAKQYKTAREIGVTGTPTLVMEDGQVLPGYVPAERLIKILENNKKNKS